MVEKEMGDPISKVMISAMSFISAMTCAPALATIAPRSAGLMRGQGPRSKASARRGDRLIDVSLGAIGHPAHDLFGHGRDDGNGVGALRGDPVASDEQTVIVPNRHVPSSVRRRSAAGARFPCIDYRVTNGGAPAKAGAGPVLRSGRGRIDVRRVVEPGFSGGRGHSGRAQAFGQPLGPVSRRPWPPANQSKIFFELVVGVDQGDHVHGHLSLFFGPAWRNGAPRRGLRRCVAPAPASGRARRCPPPS